MKKIFTNLQTVILVAGRGTRLRPYTDSMPKSLVPVRGRPFLAHLIDSLRAQGLRRFLLVAAYKADQIVDFAKAYGTSEGPISVVVAPEDLGTGGHLKYAEPLLDEEFFLLFGDTHFPISYADLYARFKKNQVPMMMAVTNVVPEATLANVELDENATRAKQYQKNVADAVLSHLDGGVFCMQRACLHYLPPQGVASALEEYVYQALIRENMLGVYEIKQEIFDIGTPERLMQYENTFFGS